LPYEKIGKNDPVCIADEVPFEIPDSWEWVRLKELVTVLGGKRIPAGRKLTTDNTGHIYIRVSDMKNGSVITDNLLYVPEDIYPSISRYIINKEDLYITVAGTIGAVGKIPPELDGANLTENADRLVFSIVDQDWLMMCLSSSLVHNQIADATTKVGQPKLAIKRIEELIISLPPLNEQRRIVERIKSVAPLLLQYNVKHVTICSLNATFPDALKKSILQQAVMGKLVPQYPNDEPASVLLERIRAEKKALIKAGKLKKDKHESIIYRRDNSHYEKCGTDEVCIDDDLPFEIPESWAVIRLNDIGVYRKGPFGSSLTKSMFIPKGPDALKVYEQKNAIRKDHTLGEYYISRQYYIEKMISFSVKPGDIIVSCAGTIGETYVLPDGIEEGIINQALMRMTIFAPIDIDYFLLYFDYVLKQSARADSKGSAIKNIPPFEIFKRLILPLPPIQEQKRIVEKVKVISEIIKFI
jgi:type I restriction enzyme S subunit